LIELSFRRHITIFINIISVFWEKGGGDIMVNKKDLIIVSLATFCLTATLFMILPTKSNPGIGEYDPWNDLNSDGAVDIYDAINLAGTYGTSGDPTKNVNVTNWLTIIQTMVATNSGRIVWTNPLPGVSDGYHDFVAIETRGFKKLCFSLTGNLTIGPYLCNLTIGWRTQGFNYSSSWRGQIEHYEEIETGIFWNAWRELDIKGENIIIILGDTYANSYEMSYYMTA
jgi:hypothetical protein